MYTIQQIRRAINDRQIIFRELNASFNSHILNRSHNPNARSVLNEDWDNLIILDACRYDAFKKCNTINGDLHTRQSMGSGTKEFLKTNFQNKSFEEVVYVTSNPQLYRHSKEINATFHDVIHVWRDEGWNDEIGTVMPATMTEHAKRVAEKYPNKALIIHYLQPHLPFLGPTSREYDELSRGFGENNLKTPSVPHDVYWRAYIETLERTLPHVEDLLSELVGKSAVTADHGHVIGERLSPFPVRDYGHWHGNYIDELVKVPWLVVESGERKKINKGVTTSEINDTLGDTEIAKNRLQKLGYLE